MLPRTKTNSVISIAIHNPNNAYWQKKAKNKILVAKDNLNMEFYRYIKKSK